MVYGLQVDICHLQTMYLLLKILIYVYLTASVQCGSRISWIPCQFTDEHVFLNNESHTETKLIHREAMLQFGQKGDSPVNPQAITFLVTGSRLDLRRYIEGVPEQMDCELRRYSTQGIHVRWPAQGAKEYNRWFSCTIKHTRALFIVTSFLRNPTDELPSGQQDYLSWPVIADREIITTTASLVMKTISPSVKVRLGAQQNLHCQFVLDHKGPNFTVEWHWQYRGERARRFSHASHLGQTHGTGVKLNRLKDGDASYTLPFAKMTSEGTYVCSVSVIPLFASLDISLNIEEAPRVSLNVGPTLSLLDGSEQKIVCEAEGYFPLDVEIDWYEQDSTALGQRVGAPLPKVLQNMLLSSHRHNQDKTYSVSAFFYLQASLRESGKQFTCRVSHQSLRVPIKKSFILTVDEPRSWIFNVPVGLIIVSLLAILCLLVRHFHPARKQSLQRKRIEHSRKYQHIN